MSGDLFNAFTRSAGASRGDTVNTTQIAPLHAAVAPSDNGFTLSLNPMRAIDAVEVLSTFSAQLASSTLVFDVEQVNFVERCERLTLAAICERLEITPLECFDANCVALDDSSLARLLAELHTSRLRLVRVDGPIERLDASAIIKAAAAGQSPLCVEFRAAASMLIEDDSRITLEVRDKEHAPRLVAENFRQYLAAMTGRSPASLSVPFHWQIERLLDASGVIQVRPIETDVFSTSVDIGVSIAEDDDAGPATFSMVYDIPSDTWHDEA